jgi:hypothetical protein
METKPSSARRHILYAVFLGLAFPLAATIVDLVAQNSRLTLANVWQVQARSYLHWMIDLVPAFLGLLAGLSARRKNRLSQENTKLAREIQERTAAIRDLGALRADLEREVDAQALELTRCSDFLEVTAQPRRRVHTGTGTSDTNGS